MFAFAVGHSGAGFAVGLAATFGFALVPVLLALGHGDFAFNLAFTEIKAGRNERMPFKLRLSR